MISRSVYALLRSKVEQRKRYPDSCDEKLRLFLEQEILHYEIERTDPSVLRTMKLDLDIFND
jgi:hypothetical protein